MMRENQQRITQLTVSVLLLILAAGTVSAHGASLSSGSREPIRVPTWLFLSTGGAAVGASFLLASFVTDRQFIRQLHQWGFPIHAENSHVAVTAGRVLGLVGYVTVLVIGFIGPSTPQTNAAILLVWVGWWAGLAMTSYLVGNTWQTLNPLSTIALVLPSLNRRYPDSYGAWPSVIGLLALIWIEVISPLAADPQLLATAVVAYSVVTLFGVVIFGRDTWFDKADPVERVFRYYGRVAPIGKTGRKIKFRLFGMDLSVPRLVDDFDEVAFIIALLWGTTFDGFVTTPGWRTLTEPLVAGGFPPQVLYPVALLAGFGLFFGIYLIAVELSRRTAETYLQSRMVAVQFAPPLLAIAAGYHFAHYLGYFLELAPALWLALLSPFSDPGTVPVYQPPSWFGGVGIAAVVIGHLVAIWVAHAAAYDLFPSRIQAIRSQYPFIAVMVFYTMTSLWVITRPEVALPYI